MITVKVAYEPCISEQAREAITQSVNPAMTGMDTSQYDIELVLEQALTPSDRDYLKHLLDEGHTYIEF